MSRASSPYTEEQELFEIEERAFALLPEELREEFQLQRKYVAEASEGRIQSTPGREQHWKQQATKLARKFYIAHLDLINQEPTSLGLPEGLAEELAEVKMSSNEMAVMMAEAFKQALQYVESRRKVGVVQFGTAFYSSQHSGYQ